MLINVDYSSHFKLLNIIFCGERRFNYDNHSFEELCVHMKNILFIFMVNFIFIHDNF